MESAEKLADAVERLRGVFLDVPGTSLSVRDASRLTGLDHPLCEEGLTALKNAHFLKQGRDGRYHRRASDSPDS